MKLNKWMRRIVLFPLTILMGVDGGDLGGGSGDTGGDTGGGTGIADTGDNGSGESGTGSEDGGVAADSPEGKAKADADSALAESAKLFTAPEKYEALKVPEGTILPEKFTEAFTEISRKYNLSQEGSESLLSDMVNTLQPIMMAEEQTRVEGVKASWFDQCKADKEIGGVNFEANAKIAERALNSFGVDALKVALNETGMGNHPEMVRLMYRIGKGMREDQVIIPDAQVGDSATDRINSFYPSMKK